VVYRLRRRCLRCLRCVVLWAVPQGSCGPQLVTVSCFNGCMCAFAVRARSLQQLLPATAAAANRMRHSTGGISAGEPVLAPCGMQPAPQVPAQPTLAVRGYTSSAPSSQRQHQHVRSTAAAAAESVPTTLPELPRLASSRRQLPPPLSVSSINDPANWGLGVSPQDFGEPAYYWLGSSMCNPKETLAPAGVEGAAPSAMHDQVCCWIILHCPSDLKGCVHTSAVAQGAPHPVPQKTCAVLTQWHACLQGFHTATARLAVKRIQFKSSMWEPDHPAMVFHN
jgi:hypothetical protein